MATPQLLKVPWVREAVARTRRLHEAGKAARQGAGSASEYGGAQHRGDYCLLNMSQVAVPGPRQAATVDPAGLLEPEDLHRLSEAFLIKKKEDWPGREELAKIRVHLGVQKGHYPALLEKMREANMLTYREAGEDVVENSVFGVWKVVGETQRLIWGGERANLFFRDEATHVDLPSPDLLSTLQTPAGSSLFLSGCDISQFYNRLSVPSFIVPFLGLPRIRSDLVTTNLSCAFVVPCLLCVPMGAKFSVALAQSISVSILRRANLSPPTPFSSTTDVTVPGGTGLQIPYIDDLNSVSTSADGANEATRRTCEALRNAGLPVEEKKTVWAGAGGPAEALGLWWWREGVITVKATAARRLLADTERVLNNGFATPHDMQRLIGLWVWPCLLRRPLLSILFEVMAFSRLLPTNRRQQLSEPVRKELNVLLDLFPLMCADLRRPLSKRVYASDASEAGGGVVYSDVNNARAFSADVRETRSLKGWYSELLAVAHTSAGKEEERSSQPLVSASFATRLQGTLFKTAVSTAWRFRNLHINMLEAEAAVLATRHMATSPISRNCRVVLLIDSTSALGAVAKGRSSSRLLNNIRRRLAVAEIAANVQILAHWVPSALNPADKPSRDVGGQYRGALGRRHSQQGRRDKQP